jgi:hypothetical protein
MLMPSAAGAPEVGLQKAAGLFGSGVSSGFAVPLMVKPFSDRLIPDALNTIHALSVIMQVTLPTNRLSWNIVLVTERVPLMSSAWAISVRPKSTSKQIVGCDAYGSLHVVPPVLCPSINERDIQEEIGSQKI